ncbi:FHA domain-containing protein [uncultured Microbacterium sp.]|uniref:FHA domain-containing protein n=1 Tax=uncultured Microbacterium sp. TaxID=191216 RepID=UPI0025E15B85|nr:FHA domain-containing protein [uncultured Microbacterium sp.]
MADADLCGWSVLPGELNAYFSGSIVALFAGDGAGAAAIERLEREQPTTALGALDLVVAEGIAGAPAMFIGSLRAGTLAGIVRGEIVVRVEDDRWHHEIVSALDARTWREFAFEGATRVSIGLMPDGSSSADPQHPDPVDLRVVSSDERPAVTGAARVGSLRWRAPLVTVNDAPRSAATTLPFTDTFPDSLFAPTNDQRETLVETAAFGRPLAHAGVGHRDADRETTPAAPRTATLTEARAAIDLDATPAGFVPASWVSAVICPNGHANPPERGTCRLCDEELSGGRLTRVTRPALGGIRFPDGVVIPITGTIVLGRAPRADATRDDPAPMLVTVPTGSTDLSRNHLRITLDGWSVLAEDLGSTNGTRLRGADGVDRPLRPGEAATMSDGDVVELGGAVLLTFVDVP